MPEILAEVNGIRHSSRLVVRELGLLQGSYRSTGCSHVQCHTLFEIDQRGQSTVAELARTLEVDKSTASRTVAQLVKPGWVNLQRDPCDKRAKLLSLTSKGRKKLREIHEAANEQVQAALEQLDESERQVVHDGMALYARALQRARRRQDYDIRPITTADNAAMARVIREVMAEFGAVGEGYSRNDPEVHNMSAAYTKKRAFYLVVTHAGTVVGGAGVGQLASAGDDICELRKMYLRSEVRGAGIGRELLGLCLEKAEQMGYTTCYLETLEHMTQARHLYEKYGFTQLQDPRGETGHFSCNAWYEKRL